MALAAMDASAADELIFGDENGRRRYVENLMAIIGSLVRQNRMAALAIFRRRTVDYLIDLVLGPEFASMPFMTGLSAALFAGFLLGGAGKLRFVLRRRQGRITGMSIHFFLQVGHLVLELSDQSIQLINDLLCLGQGGRPWWRWHVRAWLIHSD